MRKYFSVGLLIMCVFSSAVKADTYIGLDDIERALSGGKTLHSLLIDQLGEDFDSINLSINEQDIEFSQTLPNQKIGGCDAYAQIKNTQITFDLDRSTSLQLREANIEDDISLRLNISGTLKLTGDLSAKVGALCNPIISDEASLDYRWKLSGYVEAKVTFDRSYANGILNLKPRVDLINHTNLSLSHSDIDSNNFISVFELYSDLARLLVSSATPSINTRISTEIENIQANINDDMETYTVDIGSASGLSPAQLASLDRGISNIFSTSLPLEYIAAHREELLSILLSENINDSGDLASLEVFAEGVACELIYNGLKVSLKNDGSAIAANKFYETRFSEFCAAYADTRGLGNGKTITSTHSQKWTLNPALNIDWGVSSTIGNSQPFMQRNVYKNIAHNGSSCSLEMRVYKKDIAATNLKPLMMIHGGGWSQRGVSFLAMESQISHYTDAGFVVFAPFYRLTGNEDGPAECNQATGKQITADVASALEYVTNNRARYGASQGKIALFGQSAGAHLAAWLSVNEQYRRLIDKVIGYYGIYDFNHVAENVDPFNAALSSADYPGIDAGSFGTSAMSRFLGKTPTQIKDSPRAADILEHTFTDIIASNPDRYADYFLVHGKADALISPIQSAKLCDALGGFDNYAWDQPGEIFTTGLSGTNCYSRNSFLFFVDDASHGFDICPRGVTCSALHTNPNTLENNVRQSALIQKRSIDWLLNKPVSASSLSTLKPDLRVMPWVDADFDFMSAKVARSVFGSVACTLQVVDDRTGGISYHTTLASNRVGGNIDGLPIDHALLDGRYNVVYDCGTSKSHSDFTIEMTSQSCPKGSYRKIIDTHVANIEDTTGRKYDSGCAYKTSNIGGWNYSYNTNYVSRTQKVNVMSPRATKVVKSNKLTHIHSAFRTRQTSTYHGSNKRSCYLEYNVNKDELDPLTGDLLVHTSTTKSYRYKYLSWKWYQKKQYCPSSTVNLDFNQVVW